MVITKISMIKLGAKHVEPPFIEFGQIYTILYFLYFTVVMYSGTYFENCFVELNIWRENNIKIIPVPEHIDLVKFKNSLINYLYNIQAPIGTRMTYLRLIRNSDNKDELDMCVMSLVYDSKEVKLKLIRELSRLKEEGHIGEDHYITVLDNIKYIHDSVKMQLYKNYGYNKDKYDPIRYDIEYLFRFYTDDPKAYRTFDAMSL